MCSSLRQWFVIRGLALSLVVATSAARADDLADAKAALEKAGVRVLSTGLALANEGDVAKELGKQQMLKRNLLQAQKEQQAAEQQVGKAQQFLNNIKTQQVQYNAQLTRVQPGDVATNNRLVGALQALQGQYELGQQQKQKIDDQLKTSRGKANEAREAYVDFVLNTQKLAEQIEADYAKKAADPDVKAALEKYNKAAGKQFALTPSATFQASLRRLKALEDTVLSETIELRADENLLWATVTVNGNKKEDMIVDSGINWIVLPLPEASRLGIKATEKDPQIELVMADGRTLQGREVMLSSVRVGKFNVDNVECVVLGEAAIASRPTLGMSFLEHFKFEIDSAAKTLTMVKIEGEVASPPPAKAAKTP